MYEAAKKYDDHDGVFNRVILLDEMSIQEDLQVVKKGEYWELVGAVDLGPLVNDLKAIGQKKKEAQLATHCFQYLYQSFSRFRWPVAYYGSHNVNGHSIYFTFWPLVDVLSTYGFEVHGSIMDGSSNNCQFGWIMLNHNQARMLKYVTSDPYDPSHKVALMQDCKHVFKKIHNSLLSSSTAPKSVQTVRLNGNDILWQHFEQAYKFNNETWISDCTDSYPWTTFIRHLQKKCRTIFQPMCWTHMLHLFKELQKKKVNNSSEYDSVVLLLEQTSRFIEIFSLVNSKIENMHDSRVHVYCWTFYTSFIHGKTNFLIQNCKGNTCLLMKSGKILMPAYMASFIWLKLHKRLKYPLHQAILIWIW